VAPCKIVMRYWGFKVIHGRIWTHIFLSKKPLDAGTLMERFGLSKALMSLSLNDLLRHKVILEGPKSDKGTQTYTANPEILDVILNVLRRREKRMLAQIRSAHSLLSSVTDKHKAQVEINTDRLDHLGRMVTHAESTLDTILELSQLDFQGWTFMNETDEQSPQIDT
jgi:DNA-binding transcriptional regulator GbsR (MarR family)